MSALAFAPSVNSLRRPVVKRAGARVWDEAGHSRLDFDMGGGNILLGHAHPDVEAAVEAHHSRALDAAAAVEALSELAPCAEVVRFCAEESQALPAAIAAARAVTGKTRAAVYEEGGAPLALDNLAALVVDGLGASREHLQSAARLADGAGAVLIFDEGASSFRIHERGVQGASGVVPHLSVFGASLANGRPLGAVAGQADLMAALNRDDMPSPRETSLAAAGATLQNLVRKPAAGHLAKLGVRLMDEVEMISKSASADRFFSLGGAPCLPLPIFTMPHLEGVWMRESTSAGMICVSAHGLCAAHNEDDIDQLVAAYRSALPVVAARAVVELMAQNRLPVSLVTHA